MKYVSTRWFIKSLISNQGACFGVEFDGRAYMLLVARGIVFVGRRPLGDRLVEETDFDIGRIADSLRGTSSTFGF
jgi:hypothetical protein